MPPAPALYDQESHSYEMIDGLLYYASRNPPLDKLIVGNNEPAVFLSGMSAMLNFQPQQHQVTIPVVGSQRRRFEQLDPELNEGLMRWNITDFAGLEIRSRPKFFHWW